MARNAALVSDAMPISREARALAFALAALTLVASAPGSTGGSNAPRPDDVRRLAGAASSASGGGGGLATTPTAALAFGPLRPGELPWRSAGLSERQAAAHLLSRFTFGARPGDVDRVVARGLERWLEDELAATASEGDLARRLAPLRALAMPVGEMAATYPNPGLLLAQARREGVLPERPREARPNDGAMGAAGAERGPEAAGPTRDADMAGASEEARPRRDPELRRKLERFVAEKGYRRQGELLADLLTQKVMRALYTDNQLAEVMTDFWFNHFNVSLTDPQARVYVLAYERDAIRPRALGRFDELLRATARHPAMLLYLDNARSVAPTGARTALADRLGARGRFGSGRVGGLGGRRGTAFGLGGDRRYGSAFGRATTAVPGAGDRRPTGINENYARELLELHTLGVDGGYGQADVVEVARAFSGWTVVPPRMLLNEGVQRRLARVQGMGLGFVREGEFVFRPDTHDAGAKQVLGTRLPAGRGIEDGEQVLALLAAHPSTARHVATKLARRFVADEPPPALVDRLALVFQASGGDVCALLRALLRSPELWAPAARAQKVKSPFELAASALRALGAEVTSPAAVVDWVSRMGQQLYAQQAPTGWPDRAEAWVNTGSLLARMNFGLELASGRLAGVRFDLTALAGARPAGSPEAALLTYGGLLLPERELATVFASLVPLVRDEGLSHRLDAEARPVPSGMDMSEQRLGRWENPFPDYRRDASLRVADDSLRARVAGVLLGSPEFQRR